MSIDARTKMVEPPGPGMVEDHGTLSGSLGKGTVTLVGSLADAQFSGSFRLLYPKGSIYGTAKLPFTISGGMIHFRGNGSFLWGTGSYRGITSGALDIKDDNTLDGQNGVVSVTGFAKY